MRNLIFMPDDYKDLSREELVNAFLSNYYEVIIALTNIEELNTLKDNLFISIKQTSGDNAFLWKHLWLSYFSYAMHHAHFSYFCDVVRKERLLLSDIDDATFLKLLTTLNISTKILSNGFAIIGAPRLVEALLMDGHIYVKCQDIFEKREKILECSMIGFESMEFKSDFIKNSPYFDFKEFIFDSLLMLRHNYKVDQESIANCLKSVVNVLDERSFNDYCQLLSDVVSGI